MGAEKKIGGMIRMDHINFTFQVRAYRVLTAAELSGSYAFWLQANKGRRLPKNKVVTMDSEIGLGEV
jgi:hypothetical protein